MALRPTATAPAIGLRGRFSPVGLLAWWFSYPCLGFVSRLAVMALGEHLIPDRDGLGLPLLDLDCGRFDSAFPVLSCPLDLFRITGFR